MTAVEAIASNDVWAVGFQDNISGVVVEHWNGTSWSLVSSPAFASANDILDAISADVSNDVWAVGIDEATGGATTLHWDGTNWSSVAPAPVKNGSLHGVTVLSPTNVWAAGGGAGPPPSDTEAKIEHWDGSSWSVVASPNPNSRGTSLLLGIAAVSANNIWAVGSFSVIEQWNGSSWSLITPPSGVSGLKGVMALGDGTVVMVSSSGTIVEN